MARTEAIRYFELREVTIRGATTLYLDVLESADDAAIEAEARRWLPTLDTFGWELSDTNASGTPAGNGEERAERKS